MMDDDFNYPHEPAKFNTGTWMLSAEEKGAYIVLINLIYLAGGPIENCAKRLPGAIGCTKQAYRRILGRLTTMGKISVTDEGMLTNAKCERVIARRISSIQKRQEAGRKGGEKSAESRKNLEQKVEVLEAVSAENNNLPKDLLGQEEKKREDKHTPSVCVAPQRQDASRGTRLPDGWRPTADGWQFATDLGLNPDYTLCKFTDYFRSKAGKDGVKLDWPATWRNWCRTDAEKKGARPPVGDSLPLLSAIPGGKSPAASSDPWGIQGFCSSEPSISPLPDTVKPEVRQRGQWAYHGKVVDFWCRRVAEATGWGRSWHGDWSPVLRWIDLGVPLEDVCASVRRSADGYRSNGDPPITLKAFDHAIQQRRAAA